MIGMPLKLRRYSYLSWHIKEPQKSIYFWIPYKLKKIECWDIVSYQK